MAKASQESNRETRPESAEFVREVTRHQRRLFCFILSLVRNPIDADDVLQETNLVLWQKSQEYEPGSSFTAWAFSIARFQVLAFRKRQLRSRESFDEELIQMLSLEAESQADVSDARRTALRLCMQKLKPEQAKLIAERYEPGGCVNAMAERAKKSPKAMSEALSRIRAALLRCITHTLQREGLA